VDIAQKNTADTSKSKESRFWEKVVQREDCVEEDEEEGAVGVAAENRFPV
jgi:hypothetical protein